MYYYIIMFIALIITLGAEILVNSRYNKYSKVKNIKEISGFEVADQILKANGINDVYVVETRGYLSDHFDPQNKAIRLSKENFHGQSIASAAIAAHEVGHVIQHRDGNKLIKIRSMLVPFVNFSSKIGYIVILLGFILGLTKLFYLGIILLSVILLFQLVTLPVEIDASKKALECLKKQGILESKEVDSARSVLTAAALTYVASLATTILEILRLFLMANSRD